MRAVGWFVGCGRARVFIFLILASLATNHSRSDTWCVCYICSSQTSIQVTVAEANFYASSMVISAIFVIKYIGVATIYCPQVSRLNIFFLFFWLVSFFLLNSSVGMTVIYLEW